MVTSTSQSVVDTASASMVTSTSQSVAEITTGQSVVNTTIFVGESTTVTDTSGSKAGLIAGLVIGLLLLVGVVTGLAIRLYRKRRERRPNDHRANKGDVQRDDRSRKAETTDGACLGSDNCSLPDVEMQPVHLFKSHEFVLTNPNVVPPKPPRLHSYQESDDVTKTANDDRANVSAKQNRAKETGIEDNIYLNTDSEPIRKEVRDTTEERVNMAMDADTDRENNDNPESDGEEYTYMNNKSASNTALNDGESLGDEYKDTNTDTRPTVKKGHSEYDGEEKKRISAESVGEKYMGMNKSAEPTKKLLHVNTDIRLNNLGYAESDGEEYLFSPDMETPDDNEKTSSKIVNETESDRGSQDDELYIEMQVGKHEREEHHQQVINTPNKIMTTNVKQLIGRSENVEQTINCSATPKSTLPVPPHRLSKKSKNKKNSDSESNTVNTAPEKSSAGDNYEELYLNENKSNYHAGNDNVYELNTDNGEHIYTYPKYEVGANESRENAMYEDA